MHASRSGVLVLLTNHLPRRRDWERWTKPLRGWEVVSLVGCRTMFYSGRPRWSGSVGRAAVR